MVKDNEFVSTGYFRAMEWLKDEKENFFYRPSCKDVLRVALTSEFKRGRLADMVPLLSGRNFETRWFEEAIAEESFRRLKETILRYMNKTESKRFMMPSP